MDEQKQNNPIIGPQEEAERAANNLTQANEEVLERTAGVRQGDPNDSRYYGPSGLPDSGFGTGQADYGGSEHGIGSPQQNYQPGYGVVPGYGALGTQGTQGVGDEPHQHHTPSRDARIRQDVLQHLTAQPALTAYDFDVQVVNGIVTIGGRVPSAEVKRLAYDSIEPMREVRDIINQIEVSQ